MFIHIEQAKSPATINLVFIWMKKQEREFLPKDMLVFLKGTNHHLSIRDMLKNIPEGKEAEFKEAICSAVEHREHTEANLERMREIAKIGGFEAELEDANAKDKWIGNTYKRTFIAKSNEDLRANPDLSSYGTVICDFEGKTEFADLTKLPKRMIIKGDIYWLYRDFKKLPDISESIVYGDFDCSDCPNLVSLEGAPNVVGGDFYCSKTNITSLEGSPKEVGDSFNCSYCNNLTSLEGASKEVGGNFNCWECSNLTSLEGAPKEVGGCFDCHDCENLKSLEGAPEKVGKGFDCYGCENLGSLYGAPKEVGGGFSCYGCENLTSLEGAPKEVGGYFSCSKCVSLTSLVGAPEKVGGVFNCCECENLGSLYGAPKEVGGKFDCSGCYNLTSLEGAPKQVGGIFYCKSCDKLEESGIYILQDGQYYDVFNLPKDKEFVINGGLSLSEYEFEQLPDLTNVVVKGSFGCIGCSNLTSLRGAPKEVGEDFDCCWCGELKTLEGAPREVGGNFYCGECYNLTSAKGLPMHIGGEIYCAYELRPEIDKELEKRKKQTNQSTLPPNGFSNSGR